MRHNYFQSTDRFKLFFLFWFAAFSRCIQYFVPVPFLLISPDAVQGLTFKFLYMRISWVNSQYFMSIVESENYCTKTLIFTQYVCPSLFGYSKRGKGAYRLLE